jgi:predicted DNA-binding transcriptional regulator AlpA
MLEYDEALFKPADAARLCAISDTTRRRLEAAGSFPKPIVLSRTASGRPARVAFLKSELQRWIRDRVAAARGIAPPSDAA